MAEQNCGNCRYFKKHIGKGAGAGAAGQCRRFPATVVVRRNPPTNLANLAEDTVYAVWPRHAHDEWCGEWHARDADSQ